MDMAGFRLASTALAAIGDDKRREGAARAQVAYARERSAARSRRVARRSVPTPAGCGRRRGRAVAAPAATARSAARRATVADQDDRAAQLSSMSSRHAERAVEGPHQRRRQRFDVVAAPRAALRPPGSWRRSFDRAGLAAAICSAISAAGFGPWSPAPWMRPESASQLRSVSTAIALVQVPGFARSAGKPRRTTCTAAAGRSAAPGFARRRRPRSAERARSRRASARRWETRRSGLAGDPVDLRQRRASNTCSHALPRSARAVAERQSAQDHLGGLARDAVGARPAPTSAHAQRERASARRATPRTASTRCGRGRLACPFAAAASVAIMPATPSTLARAWPCPQPSATTSTTPPRHFPQSSSLPRRPSTPSAHRRSFAGSSATGRTSGTARRRACRPARRAGGRTRSSKPSAREPPSSRGSSGRPNSRSPLAAGLARARAARVPAERERGRLDVPGRAQPAKSGRRRTCGRGSAPSRSASAGRAACRARARRRAHGGPLGSRASGAAPPSARNAAP